MTSAAFKPVQEAFGVLSSDDRNRAYWLFLASWLFIIVVSVVDGYLVLEYRTQLVELNPQGRVLIELNSGQVWYLLTAKFLGTVTACAILLIIHRNHARAGTTIAAVIAALQFGLLLFFVLAPRAVEFWHCA
jgi:hypothetical protein